MNTVRKKLLQIIPYIVWTLNLSIIYTFIIYKIEVDFLFDLSALNSENYYIKGLFLGVPLCILGISANRLKHFWQILIVSAVVIVSAYMLSGCILFTGLTIFIFLARLSARTKGEVCFLEQVNYWFTLILIGIFLITAITKDEFIQKMAFYHLLLEVIVTFMYTGIKRFEDYIDLKQGKANVPIKTILDTATRIFLACFVIVFIVIFPIVKTQYSFVSIDLPTFNYIQEEEKEEVQEQIERPENSGGGIEELYTGTESEFLKKLWAFVDKFLLTLVYLGVLIFAIVSIYKLIVNFNKTQVQKQDVIESTFKADGDSIKKKKQREKFEDIFDFSKGMNIRRQYKKMLKKHNPEQWQTPTEMEQNANLNIPELHAMYEEVRYGNSSK